MSRYAVRIGSAVALLLTLFALARTAASAADHVPFVFEGKRIVIGRLVAQSGGRAVAIDDPGLRALFAQIGATVTWEPGERYVLVTTAEPVVVSFAIGDRHYDVGPVTQTAGFPPFNLDGHAYVPFDELLHALDLAPKSAGGQTILQPQLASVDMQSDGRGAKIVAHGGMPLDARIVSDAGDKLVLAFDGVGTTLPPSRTLSGGPVTRMEVRTDGTAAKPRTLVTLYLAPGTKHTAVGTDDQRDFTMGFNGAPAGQAVGVAPAPAQPAPQQVQPQPEPTDTDADTAPAASPLPSPQQQSQVQVTSVLAQPQNGGVAVRVAIAGDASYEWHRLRPPDNRFWLDIHNARLGMPPSDSTWNGAVSAVRVHQQSPDTVRIALSLGDFDAIQVTPDATGVTIAVQNQPVDVASVPHSGSGSVGAGAAVAMAPPSPSSGRWKFNPRPAPLPAAPAYVAPNPRLIVIDPGHGGSDSGAVRGDAVEKALTLDISRRLRDLLVARGWQVIMTRDTDKDVYAPNDSAHDELQARVDVANTRGARLFVSVHVNSYINAGPHGATVYYYKPMDVALAQALDRRIGSELRIANDGTVKDKLYVVHHASMPAALVETAFVSNPDDRALLESADWRQKMAQAIADGIGDYTGPAPAAGTLSGQ